MVAVGMKQRQADPLTPLPDEQSILQEAGKIFSNVPEWLTQQHPMLGGRTPEECLDAGDEQSVRDLLRSIKFVGQT